MNQHHHYSGQTQHRHEQSQIITKVNSKVNLFLLPEIMMMFSMSEELV